ncbi:MAG TPA: DMT family transporter [Acidobacteriaceae bacterium]
MFFAILVAIAAGTANPFQSGTNAELNKQLGLPLLAGLWVYFSGLAGLALVAVAARQFTAGPLGRASAAMHAVPWWAWLGGLISIGSTMAGVLFAQRLGSGTFTGLSITASLLTSVLLDQFGWIGFKQHAASPLRLGGCALLLAGVWLVSRS